MNIGALHDDVTALQAGLDATTHELEAVARRLRDSTPEDVAPAACATSVTDAITALAARLEGLAGQAHDGSAVVARHVSEPGTGPSIGGSR